MSKASYFLLGLFVACSVEPVSRERKEEPRPLPLQIFPEAPPTKIEVEAKAPQMNQLPSGLIIEDLSLGTGLEATPGKELTVHYTGKLTDGTTFDSSIPRGTPLVFRPGEHHMIEGWEQGFAGMRVGGKRRLTIPPGLAYGTKGAGSGVPPNATLIFEVELLGVK
jgi:FKBP-type peptidyl-prolyl cis-trans isomerase